MMKEYWYVVGDTNSGSPMLFMTKIEAEAHARKCFPNEAADKRYARVKVRSHNIPRWEPRSLQTEVWSRENAK